MLPIKNFAGVLQKVNKVAVMQAAASSTHFSLRAIGQREIVGFGAGGLPHYIDRLDYPFPAVRFKETTGDIARLREKEKGDWKNLSVEEKKAIYRASFCQTFSEMEAPTGQWKMVVGWTFFFLGTAIWLAMGVKKFVYPPLPESFSEESRKQQLRRMIDIRTNPITGIASKWDFEKDTWKK